MEPQRRMYKGSYVVGSAAPKYEPTNVPSPKKKQTVKRQTGYTFCSFKKNVITGVLLFTPCIMLLGSFSLVAKSSYQIQTLTRQVEEVRMENDKIKMDITKASNGDEVKKIAMARLGMQEPDRYQIVQISVPKSDYTVIEEASSKTENTDYAWIQSFIRR